LSASAIRRVRCRARSPPGSRLYPHRGWPMRVNPRRSRRCIS